MAQQGGLVSLVYVVASAWVPRSRRTRVVNVLESDIERLIVDLLVGGIL